MQVFKTAFLLTLLTLFLLVIGEWVGGQGGMLIALIIAAITNAIAYFYSDKIALSTYSAQPVTREQLPRVYRILESLTGRENLPMPKVYVIPTDAPNAFATGRDPQHASVAVTQGILNLLDDQELEGVLGHELGHVRNRDILISSVAATIAGAVMFLARMAEFGAMFGGGYGERDREDRGGGMLGIIAMAILAPLAATLIQLWISRTREFAADESGAKWTGNPEALARALEKLDAYSKRRPLVATPSTAHLFIVQPFTREWLTSLFSTHPPISARIERLIGRPTVLLEQ
jgi:heat shock protein HtpX